MPAALGNLSPEIGEFKRACKVGRLAPEGDRTDTLVPMIHLRSHTGLRGVAALMVIPLHLNLDRLNSDLRIELIEKYFRGDIAVDLFFILSGFILRYVYLSNRQDAALDWGAFYRARLARVYPLHIVTLVVMGAILAMAAALGHTPERDYTMSDVFPQIFLIHALPGIEVLGWVGPSWSISMEMLAYISIFPIFYCSATYIEKYAPKRKVGAFWLSIVLVLMTFDWLVHRRSISANLSSIEGWVAVARVSLCFATGFILEGIRAGSNRMTTHFQAHGDLAGVALVLAYYFCPTDSYQGIIIFILLPLFVLSMTGGRSVSARILGSRVFFWLGTISYSIYLLHPFFGKVLTLYEPSGRLGTAIQILLMILLAGMILLVSAVSYHFVETPLRRRLLRTGGSRASSSIPAPTKPSPPA